MLLSGFPRTGSDYVRGFWAQMPYWPLRGRWEAGDEWTFITTAREHQGPVQTGGRGKETRRAQDTLRSKCQKGGSQGPKGAPRRSLHLPAFGQVDENYPHFTGNRLRNSIKSQAAEARKEAEGTTGRYLPVWNRFWTNGQKQQSAGDT